MSDFSTIPYKVDGSGGSGSSGSSGGGITSGTWAVAGVVFLGLFAAVGAWLHRHNQERKPLDFWGFDSHRVISSAPTVVATLIKPDPLVLTVQTPGDLVWHDDLFMIVENRYLIEKRADVASRPEFLVKITNQADVDEFNKQLAERKPDDKTKLDPVKPEVENVNPEASLRGPLRANRSYDWKSFPWSEAPQWRYALTFAQEETTFPGTKHELKRTFTFTLVFDVTCRWVTLQSVEKLTALQPDVQQRLKKFFLDVFPGSDTMPAPVAAGPAATATGTPTATSTATGAPISTNIPTTPGPAPATPMVVDTPLGVGPAGTGLQLGNQTIIKEEPATTAVGVPSLTTSLTTGATSPPLSLSPSPLLQPSSAGSPLFPTAAPSGTIILPNFPTTTSTLKP